MSRGLQNRGRWHSLAAQAPLGGVYQPVGWRAT